MNRVILAPVLAVCAAWLLGPAGAGEPTGRPRLLALPWLVIDRNTNRECTSPEAPGAAGKEAASLAAAAQAALDAEMHRHRMVDLVPRREWAPEWERLSASRVLWKGAGCAVCAPPGELIRYDRALVQQLAKAVGADFVWLGVTVVPLTPDRKAPPADDCCRDSLARERKAVLARSSVVLVRASDGEIVWQRDARRLESDVFQVVGRVRRSESRRRSEAVNATAHLLGSAFRREHREAVR